MPDSKSDIDVFVNCPFDDDYRPMFEAIVFAIHDCGFLARCSLEVSDASQVRIEKIGSIIGSCRFGIHDISRTELDADHGLPRFNMPFELGMFLGAKRFGSAKQKNKTCLILDVEKYRYQKFISDIAGQDIAAHHGKPEEAITAVRDWLSATMPKSVKTPGGTTIASRYAAFRNDLPEMCARVQLNADELTFNDYVLQVEEWLTSNAKPNA
ncbi:MAG TPA: hypothetical protein VEU30_10695 [Thermoanaerobaculia bacterium]|nr:hypothetical protein [Thermoanaerobaculia bacterium]